MQNTNEKERCPNCGHYDTMKMGALVAGSGIGITSIGGILTLFVVTAVIGIPMALIGILVTVIGIIYAIASSERYCSNCKYQWTPDD